MTRILHYSMLALGVLIFAVVFMVCEGSCASCVHACCAKLGHSDERNQASGRVAPDSCTTAHDARRSSGLVVCASRSGSPPLAAAPQSLLGSVAPLRI